MIVWRSFYLTVLFDKRLFRKILYKFEWSLIDVYMEKNKHILSEPEVEYLKEGLKRTYKERFEMATRLYKAQLILDKATITHKPFISK